MSVGLGRRSRLASQVASERITDMLRIAVLFEYPTLLGGERSLLAAIERLRSRFEFVALAPQSGPLAGALCETGVNRIPSPLFDSGGHRLSRSAAVERLRDAVRLLQPDLLHGNSLAMGRLTGAVAPQLDVPCTAHLRDIITLSQAAVSDLNGNARLIAVSDATRQFHVAQGLDSTRTVVVPNGVDLDRFRPADRGGAVRRELGLDAEAFVALAIGQISLRKGWDVLAGAMEQIAGRFPRLHLVLAGRRYSDKPETVAYEQSVRDRLSAAMPGRAHFVGHRDDVPALMNAADLLVHSARQEPFGRVLLEAAASGLPIVATNVGGTPEMLEHGVSAWLVPPGDAEALAQAVSAMLTDAGLRSRLSRAARARIEATFSIAQSAQRLEAAWHQACL